MRSRDPSDLFHQLLVNGETSRRVDDADVAPDSTCLFHPRDRHRHGIGRLAVHRHTRLLTEYPQLFDRSRALQVSTHKHRVSALLFPPQRELRGCRCLPRALQACEKHDRRGARGVGDLERLAAQNTDQLLVDRLHHLLPRSQALRDDVLGATSADRFDELANDTELHIRFEEGRANLAERLVQVCFAQPAAAPQAASDPLETIGKCVEHEEVRLPDSGRSAPRHDRQHASPDVGHTTLAIRHRHRTDDTPRL